MSVMGGTGKGLFTPTSSFGSINVPTVRTTAAVASGVGATAATIGKALVKGVAVFGVSAAIVFGLTGEGDFDEGGYFNHE